MFVTFLESILRLVTFEKELITDKQKKSKVSCYIITEQSVFSTEIKTRRAQQIIKHIFFNGSSSAVQFVVLVH